MNILYKLYKLVLCLAVLIPEPKQTYFIYYWLLEQVRFAVLAEMLLRWRRGDVKYFMVVPLIIIFNKLMTTITADYRHKHWKVVLASMRLKRIIKIRKWRTIVLNFDMLSCCITGVFPALYFNIPYMVYSTLAFGSTMCLMKAILADRLIWHITIGYRMDINAALHIHTKIYPKMDILDIRYFLCDELRKRYNTLEKVKALLEAFPGYLHLPDRYGMSPFQLACQNNSLDVVRYMVELDDTLLDRRDEKGDSPLHIACRYMTTLDVIHYLLQKRMSLVTIPNKTGDLPIHVAGDALEHYTDYAYYPECIEVVWRLLLAYPDCLNCVSGSTSCSNGKDIDDKKE